ncbi:hypothetical protein [Chryseobacterium sp.]|uniref:hypothetical protein n=1 Tax=Chryseobacterium sp. TaxID=1871047 RepID=UPI0012A7E2FE|nr:hypothetical protein [Chryseobacterium sp.]QFG53655.1 hypothetical protein F7R58_08850 [Chryseobacterium sp.]
MKYEDYFQDQSTIQINVMKVNGRKLTKSLIDQFKSEWPFDPLMNFTGEKIFGYVKLKTEGRKALDRIIIAQKDGKLVRYSWDKAREISHITGKSKLSEVNNNASRTLRTLFGDEQYGKLIASGYYNEDHELYKIDDVMDEKALEKLMEVAHKASEFLKELEEHQILI